MNDQIVISSRIRLARNLADYPFPSRMLPGQGAEINAKIEAALKESSEAFAGSLNFIEMDSLDFQEKQVLVEKHLISSELCDGRPNAAVVTGFEEKISIMINEEDHLRIQGIYPELKLDEAWNICKRLDKLIQEKLDFAYDDTFGYLTCCPTNVGTGLRASVMMHLPALYITGYIRSIYEACSKLGIAVRGMYGENSDSAGNICQVSNQVTLGQSEEEIIAGVKNIALQIIEQENLLRAELYKKSSSRFEDKIFRAAGVLSSARMLTSEESLNLLSDVRLGVDMSLITGITSKELNELTYKIQPASLQKLAERALNPDERDVMRASVMRKSLGSWIGKY